MDSLDLDALQRHCGELAPRRVELGRLSAVVPRRRSLGVLAILGLQRFAAPGGAGAKSGKRKKCKKCERCPQRRCCSCTTIGTCHYVKADQECPVCSGTVINPQPGIANFCTRERDCVQVDCPVA